MFFKKIKEMQLEKMNTKCRDCASNQNNNEIITCLSQCSGALSPVQELTNHELCDILKPLLDEILESGNLQEETSKPLLIRMKEVLNEVLSMVENSYTNVDVYADYVAIYSLSKPYFMRPISARQSYCASLCLDMLHNENFFDAFRELYDALDDFGYQYRKWDGKRKLISCNEGVLFSLLIREFHLRLSCHLDNLV